MMLPRNIAEWHFNYYSSVWHCQKGSIEFVGWKIGIWIWKGRTGYHSIIHALFLCIFREWKYCGDIEWRIQLCKKKKQREKTKRSFYVFILCKTHPIVMATICVCVCSRAKSFSKQLYSRVHDHLNTRTFCKMENIRMTIINK